MMKSRTTILALGVLSGAVLAMPTVGQEGKRDPKVQLLFDQVLAAYKTMPAYQEKVTFKYAPDAAQDHPQGQPVSLDVKLQKPNKISVSYVEKVAIYKTIDKKTVFESVRTVRHQIVSDGATVYRWRSDKNTYTKTKSGAGYPDLPPALVQPELEILLRGKDPFKDLPIPGNLLSVGAPVKVGDTMLDVLEGKISDLRITFTGKLKMLFGQKDRTVRSIVFEGDGKDPKDGHPLSFRVEAAYEQVTPSPTLTAADFKFTPPAGSTEEPAAGN